MCVGMFGTKLRDLVEWRSTPTEAGTWVLTIHGNEQPQRWVNSVLAHWHRLHGGPGHMSDISSAQHSGRGAARIMVWSIHFHLLWHCLHWYR